jgi:DnaJ family protein C protein 13
VDTLKAAAMDLKAGERITAILNASPIWAQYKDQRHDLFLPASRTQAITGGATGVAGYILDVQHNSHVLPTQPPPPPV